MVFPVTPKHLKKQHTHSGTGKQTQRWCLRPPINAGSSWIHTSLVSEANISLEGDPGAESPSAAEMPCSFEEGGRAAWAKAHFLLVKPLH